MDNKELCEIYRKKVKKGKMFMFGIVILMFVYLISPYTEPSLWLLGMFFFGIATIYHNYYDKKYNVLNTGLVGEEATEQLLQKLDSTYEVLQNVILNVDGRRAELDFVVLSQKGIIIIETKNYNGTLIGDKNDQELTYKKISRSGEKYRSRIRNPLKQAGREVYLLKEYLKKKGINKYIDYYVYLSNGTSMVETDKIIFSERQLLDVIQDCGKDNYLSIGEIEAIKKYLN